MADYRAKSSFLTRDRNKRLLELSQAEVDCWVPRVFDKIRPQMTALNTLLFENNDPANLTVIVDMTMDQVREVAREMANTLMTPERTRELRPLLDSYCDELLALGYNREAAFVQYGLLRLDRLQAPERNPLLVEVCAQALVQQVNQISMIAQGAPKVM